MTSLHVEKNPFSFNLLLLSQTISFFLFLSHSHTSTLILFLFHYLFHCLSKIVFFFTLYLSLKQLSHCIHLSRFFLPSMLFTQNKKLFVKLFCNRISFCLSVCLSIFLSARAAWQAARLQRKTLIALAKKNETAVPQIFFLLWSVLTFDNHSNLEIDPTCCGCLFEKKPQRWKRTLCETGWGVAAESFYSSFFFLPELKDDS